MGMNKDARDRLRDFLTKAAESAVTITDFRRLPGGAVQENWLLDITVAGGDWPGKYNLVLRRDAASPVAASHGRLQEFQILKLVHKAGVTVPMPCLMGEDPAVIGGPFFIMHRLTGEAAGHRRSLPAVARRSRRRPPGSRMGTPVAGTEGAGKGSRKGRRRVLPPGF